MVDQSVWNKPHHVVKIDKHGRETVVAQYDTGVKAEGSALVDGCLDPKNRYESRLGDASDRLERKSGWFGGKKPQYQVTETDRSGQKECWGKFGDPKRADLAKRGLEGHAEGTNSGCKAKVRKFWNF